MVKDFAAGDFDALICYDLDRLTRQPRQLEDWIDAAEERGLVLVTANGEADLSTDNGRLFARIKASVARAEVERKGARQRAANMQRTAAGMPHAGRRPYGWQADRITKHEVEAPFVAGAFECILAGESVRAVTRWLNENGSRTSQNREWSPVTVRKMLLRERNAGLLIRHGEEQAGSQIEPIVSREDYEAVRAMLTDPERDTRRGRVPQERFLSGVMLCPCGSTMGAKAIHGKGRKTPSYVCRVTERAGAAGSGHVSIAAHIAETAVVDALHGVLVVSGGHSGADTAEVVRLRAELSEVDERVRRAADLYMMDGVPRAYVTQQLAALNAERERIRTALDRALADRASDALLASIEAAFISPGSSDDEFGTALQDSYEAFVQAFASLDVEKQRTITKSALTVTVRSGGKGADRLVMVAR